MTTPLLTAEVSMYYSKKSEGTDQLFVKNVFLLCEKYKTYRSSKLETSGQKLPFTPSSCSVCGLKATPWVFWSCFNRCIPGMWLHRDHKEQQTPKSSCRFFKKNQHHT